MAEKKISQLNSATTPLTGTETLPIVQGGATKKITASALTENKQDTLVSGTNIKTIEGNSLLGSGNIDLSKSDVGLGNVDNTSDANKPISTATQTALNGKQATLVSGTNIKTINSTSLLGSGDITISGSNIYSADGTLTAARTLTQGGFALTIAGTTSSRFFSNGNVGVGTTTDAGYKLDVNGTIRSTSDIRIAGGAQYCIGLLAGASNTKLQVYTNQGVNTMHSIIFGYYSTTFDAQDITFNGPVNSKFFGQSTGNWIIGSTTSYASAQLAIDSTTKGFLPPRMTTTQRNAISSPAAGLIVYDTTDNKHYGYNGTTWNAFF